MTTPLIPRSLLFGNPEYSHPTASPDGRYLAWLADVDGALNIWLAPLDDLSAARPVTRVGSRGVPWYAWAYDNAHLLYLQDRDGDENWHLHAVHHAGGGERDLTPFAGAQAQLQGISHRYPSEILVGVNDRDPRLHDLMRIDLRTGAWQRIFENTAYVQVVTDLELRARLGVRPRDDHGYDLVHLAGRDAGNVLLTIPVVDNSTTNAVAITADDRLLLQDSRGRNLTALVEVPLDGSPPCVLCDGGEADITDILIHPWNGRAQAVARSLTRQHWQSLAGECQVDLTAISAATRGDWRVLSRTLDDGLWLIADVVSDGPTRYLRYDRACSRIAPLFTSRPALEHQPLVPMRPVIIPARDGLRLVSYLTLPVAVGPATAEGTEPAERPERPLPLVLWVHGGPWWRDSWGFDPLHQWLANRGYAVLSVNFRGSTGFGKAFLNAGDREWAGRMHDDLIDAVDWAIGAGIANAGRIAICGGSYGGYAALVGMTFTPGRFACGVSLVGPPNLLTFLRNVPPYWQPLLPLLRDRIGDFESEEGRAFLASRSPITRVARITGPLLIAQGANDPRVVKSESDQFVAALTAKRLPVTYLLYPDEGHDFCRPANRMSFFAAMEAFLARHLHGRYEPASPDQHGTSLQIIAGEELMVEPDTLAT